MVTRQFRGAALAFGALIGLAACGDDDGSDRVESDAGALIDATAPSGEQQQSRPDAGQALPITSMDAGNNEPAKPTLYAVSTRVFTADSAQVTTYVQLVSSLDQGATLDTKKATEFGGAAELFSLDDPRWLAVGEGESPLLSSYSLANGPAIKKEKTISLQNNALQSFFSNKLYQVSATKIYLPDPDNAQLITIDPTNMSVLGAIALPTTVREGYTPVYSYDYVQRGGKLLFAVAWFDWTNDKILPETGLVSLDTAADQATVTVDSRCGGLTTPITLPSGDTYFPSSSLAAAGYQLNRLSTEPCVLRIKAGEATFDTTYHMKLRELTGGAVAGEPAPTGGEEIFLRVLDTSLATISADTASYGLTGQAAWRWRRWNPATNTLSNVDALAPSSADAYWYEVDGRVFYAQPTSDYAMTTLIELNAAGGPKNALTGPGLISGLARVQ